MKHMPTAHVPLPELVLESAGAVGSAQFGDIYFSREDGEAETQHVFIRGNRLPERFTGRKDFTIGELGFGTGLNFLTTWKIFLETTDATQHLHYISVEKFPLSLEQLTSLLPHNDRNNAFLQSYPLRLPGWHRIYLERCTLTLGFGEALDLWRGTEAQIDAWFLDGFAPAKNPDMWNDALFAELARLSAPDASFATFTAAGAVKRGLIAQGFTVEKQKGYGRKRDMLVGHRTNSSSSDHLHQASSLAGEGIIVVGAGIAGCTLARALAERGMEVTVLDAGQVASGASGNPAGALYPQLTKYYTPATAWHATGYALMLRQLTRWKAAGLVFAWHPTGMLVMPRDHDPRTLLETLMLDPAIARFLSREQASHLAGTALAADAIFLPQAGWLNPAELCRALLDHPCITLREHTVVKTISREGERWNLHTDVGTLYASCIIVCNATQAADLLPHPLPLGRSAGQVTVLEQTIGLKHIISHRGYLIPCGDQLLIGATYDHEDFSRAVTEANHRVNIGHARAALPDWAAKEKIIGGRTSLRATTPDRLPYVGEVEPGLYVSIGHGSRGMISAPLAAEVIAAQITGEMVPLTPELKAAIDPLRRSAPASR